MSQAISNSRFRAVLAQLNFLVGDVAGNLARIESAVRNAQERFAPDLVVFPELTLTGYPPEDLLHHPGLRHQVEAAEAKLAALSGDTAILVGFPEYVENGIYNTAALYAGGREQARYRKQIRPNYSVFDEKRYFLRGTESCVVELAGLRLGLTICEDLWHAGPAERAAEQGADILLNISASPYEIGKQQQRAEVFGQRARESGRPLLTVNHVCGQDELVFDGGSFSMSADGTVAARAPEFETGLYPVDFERADGAWRPVPADVHVRTSEAESMYGAIVLGVRDYVAKNGFPGAVIGLSGGIDSALTLAIAVDALGPERVRAVMMPSRYTADISLRGAKEQAERQGVQYDVIAIEPAFNTFLEMLEPAFAGAETDATEENIQARCRGIVLMALSNKTGRVVLTTGNKSELAVGYATLYGDMAGGFAPIRDVFKTRVYELANYRNSVGYVIPQEVIDRPPSAELRADQKDSDSLPDYAELDSILEAYIEDDLTFKDIVAKGFDARLVRRVVGMVQRNEYKRRQAPPGVRVSRRAFGRDRRYPITSGYDPQAEI